MTLLPAEPTIVSTPLLPVALTNPEIVSVLPGDPSRLIVVGTGLTGIAQRVARVTATVERVAAGGVISDRVRIAATVDGVRAAVAGVDVVVTRTAVDDVVARRADDRVDTAAARRVDEPRDRVGAARRPIEIDRRRTGLTRRSSACRPRPRHR